MKAHSALYQFILGPLRICSTNALVAWGFMSCAAVCSRSTLAARDTLPTWNTLASKQKRSDKLLFSSCRKLIDFQRNWINFIQQFHSAISFSNFIQQFHSAISFSNYIQQFHSAISFSNFIQQFHSAISFIY